jgi:hypothetical protein
MLWRRRSLRAGNPFSAHGHANHGHACDKNGNGGWKTEAKVLEKPEIVGILFFLPQQEMLQKEDKKDSDNQAVCDKDLKGRGQEVEDIFGEESGQGA